MIEDRLQIQALYVTYAHALDAPELDLLDACFTPDARLEYRTLGAVFTRDEFKAVAERNLAALDATQHVVTNFSIEVAGDTATGHVAYTARHVRDDLAPEHLYTTGGWYEDTLVRDAAGWRIATRVARPVWSQGNPAVLGLPATGVVTAERPRDDRALLRDLVEGYASTVDARDVAGFVALWTPDAELSVHQGDEAPVKTWRGLDELAGVVDGLRSYSQTVHQVTDHRVQLGDREATGIATCVAHHVQAGARTDDWSDLTMMIRYVDRYRFSEPEGWRFSQRACRMQWTTTQPVERWFGDSPPTNPAPVGPDEDR